MPLTSNCLFCADQELKEDNSILEETKAMLEDQLEGSRKRIETVVELESEMRRYRQQLEELTKVILSIPTGTH